MKPIPILFLLLFVACQEPENNKPTTSNAALHQHREIEDWSKYDFSYNIKQKAASPENADMAAIAYSNMGNYFSSLQVFDAGREPIGNPPVFFDSSNFKAIPAIDYILQEAAKNQIIIINEAHHVSYHRFFTLLLLQKLSKLGFHYFGAETLSAYDSLLNERGYPLINSGFYTTEPQYGNLIREAFNSGYTVFAYEASAGKNGMPREIEQARNIEKILKKNPKAKIVIHCGYGHLIEGSLPEWGKAMAGRLKEYTGIDPLTIDQVELTEHFGKEYENPYYRKMNNTGFVVFKPSEKTLPPRIRMDDNQSDIFVYHPRTHLKFNRPHWLFSYYTPVFINPRITIATPVLAKAYLANEDEKNAVPVDVIEIQNTFDSTALALFPEKSYKIILENKQKEQQVIEWNLR